MKAKEIDHAQRARTMQKMAEQVERCEVEESGLDEAELKVRMEALDMDGTLPEPLAAALRALSGGLRRSHNVLHGDDGASAE